MKQLLAAAKKHGMTTPVFASSSASQPGAYTFASPFGGMGEIDAFLAAWQEIYASVPDAVQAVNEAALRNDVAIAVTRPDLSYVPAKPRLAQGEANFSRVIWLRPHPDQVQALEKAIAEFNALSKKHGDDRPANVFQQVIGDNAPAYGVMISDENQAAFFTHGAKQQEKWGSDWSNASARLMPLLRSMDFSASVPRPDLSYQP